MALGKRVQRLTGRKHAANVDRRLTWEGGHLFHWAVERVSPRYGERRITP